MDLEKGIDINQLTPTTRVALRNDSYTLHKILPNKIDPLVSLMRVEKVPDSTYDMVGGLDKQIKEIKEVGRSPIEPIRTHSSPIQRSLNSPSSIQNSLQASELPSQREFSSTALPEQGRRECSLHLVPCWGLTSKNNQSFSSCCRTSHGLHLHSSVWVGACSKVHRRGFTHGP